MLKGVNASQPVLSFLAKIDKLIHIVYPPPLMFVKWLVFFVPTRRLAGPPDAKASHSAVEICGGKLLPKKKKYRKIIPQGYGFGLNLRIFAVPPSCGAAARRQA